MHRAGAAKACAAPGETDAYGCTHHKHTHWWLGGFIAGCGRQYTCPTMAIMHRVVQLYASCAPFSSAAFQSCLSSPGCSQQQVGAGIGRQPLGSCMCHMAAEMLSSISFAPAPGAAAQWGIFGQAAHLLPLARTPGCARVVGCEVLPREVAACSWA